MLFFFYYCWKANSFYLLRVNFLVSPHTEHLMLFRATCRLFCFSRAALRYSSHLLLAALILLARQRQTEEFSLLFWAKGAVEHPSHWELHTGPRCQEEGGIQSFVNTLAKVILLLHTILWLFTSKTISFGEENCSLYSSESYERVGEA